MSNFRARLSSQKYFLLSYIFILIGKVYFKKVLTVMRMFMKISIWITINYSVALRMCSSASPGEHLQLDIHYMHKYVW